MTNDYGTLFNEGITQWLQVLARVRASPTSSFTVEREELSVSLENKKQMFLIS